MLRAETEALSEAYAEVLTSTLGEAAVLGVYRKGSAQKPWGSRIDYVPLLSDVDIHVRLASDADVARLDDLDVALEVADAAVEAYHARVVAPLHVPKPQLNILNMLEADADIVPSPASTVAVVFGEPYHELVLTEAQRGRQRARDREQLLASDAFIEALPLRAIDRPGVLLERLVSELSWRVSPVAPRALSVLGMAFEEAWSLNRTALVAALEARGVHALASAYARWYLGGWDTFLGGWEGGRGSALVRAGVEVLTLGRALGRALGESAGEPRS